MRRRVKEQLKRIGGMEFWDTNFSYIDKETQEEIFVGLQEEKGSSLIESIHYPQEFVTQLQVMVTPMLW